MFVQINSIPFTPREIDVIACILAGRSAKKIALLLSISVKTAENHIHNIMLKLGYNCREKIVDFLETTEHVFYLRKHYIDLLIRSNFELELKKMSALIKETVSVAVYYMNQQDVFCSRLYQDLQITGFKVISILCSNKRSAEQIYNTNATHHSIYIISNWFIDWYKKASHKIDIDTINYYKKSNQAIIIGILQEEVSAEFSLDLQKKSIIEFIDLKQENNYYFMFFKVLTKLLGDLNVINSSLELFKKQYDVVFNVPLSLPAGSANKLITELSQKPSKQQTLYIAFNLPPRNNKFVGRDKELKQLSTKLYEKKFGIITQTICGLGGIGKTQLAMEFAYQSIESKTYKMVLWIPAETTSTINLSYQKCAEQLCLDSKHLSPKELQKLVYDHLNISCAGSKILFILDNVECSKDLKYYLDLLYKQSAGYFIPHVLITSRSQDWPEPQLALETFTMEEAYVFIKTQLPKEDQLAINNLSNTLAYFPLALSQAIAYIRAHSNIEDYLLAYNENKKNYLEKFINIDDFYTKSLWKTWNLVLEKLNRYAQKFLFIAAYLDSDSIPIDAFQYMNVINRMNVIEELRRYSLITLIDNKSFKVHRLLQEAIRLNHYNDATWINCAIDLVEDNFDFNYLNPEKWNLWNLYLVHALTVTEHAIKYSNRLIERGIKLYAKAAMFMTHILIEFKESKSMWLKLIKITKHIHRDKPTSLLLAMINVRLGIVKFCYGIIEEAIVNFNLAISIYKHNLQVHPKITKLEADLINILRWISIKENIYFHEKIIYDLGHAFTLLGNLYTKTLVKAPEAISNYKEALLLFAKIKDIPGLNKGIGYHNTEITYHLAMAYIFAGNLQETERLLHQTRILIQNGHVAPRQQGMIYLSSALFNMHIGKSNEAQALLFKAIDILSATISKNHFLIQIIKTYMGCNNYILGNIDLAKVILEDTIKYWTEANYSYFLWFSKLYLARVYESLGKYEAAIKTIKTAAIVIMEHYKEDLHNSMKFQMFRVDDLSLTNQNAQLSYWQEALICYIQLFGENHYQLARYYYLLGRTFARSKQLKQAMVQYKKSLTILKAEPLQHQNLLQLHQQNILILEKLTIKNK